MEDKNGTFQLVPRTLHVGLKRTIGSHKAESGIAERFTLEELVSSGQGTLAQPQRSAEFCVQGIYRMQRRTRRWRQRQQGPGKGWSGGALGWMQPLSLARRFVEMQATL